MELQDKYLAAQKAFDKGVIENEQVKVVGEQLIIELYGCDAQKINDIAYVEKVMMDGKPDPGEKEDSEPMKIAREILKQLEGLE